MFNETQCGLYFLIEYVLQIKMSKTKSTTEIIRLYLFLILRTLGYSRPKSEKLIGDVEVQTVPDRHRLRVNYKTFFHYSSITSPYFFPLFSGKGDGRIQNTDRGHLSFL